MTAVVVIGQRSIVAKKVGTDETPLVVQQSTVNAAVQVLPVPKQVVVVKGLKGDNGLPVELQSSATHLQWRYVGTGAWADLVALADITGPSGGVTEAPSDGTAYARKDAAWVASLTASEISALLADKVDVVSGKGLSTNDFTGTYKTNLDTLWSNRWQLSYSAAVPDNSGGLDNDYHLTVGSDWVYLYKKGPVTPGVWTYTGVKWVSETGIATLLSGKADVNATLTDAAASSTLPATTSTALSALLQTVRNCLKYLTTSSVFLTGAQTIAGIKTFTNRLVAAGAYTPTVSVAFSATPTFDCSLGNVFELGAMTANITSMTVSNAAAGQTINIRLVQDGTGGRTAVVPSGAKVSGTLNTAANGATWLVLIYSSAGARLEGAWSKVPA